MKKTFITGLFILLPLMITFWVLRFVMIQIDNLISPLALYFIRGSQLENLWIDYLSPLLSVALAFLVISLVGFVGGNVLGRQMIQWIEKWVLQVPVVRSIYSATRQFVDTFSQSTGKAFRRVVMVEYPRQGAWTMGFVTNDMQGEIPNKLQHEVMAIFLPTTPNPTSGWLVFVPPQQVISLDMSVDDAFKLIVSGGVLSSQQKI